MVPPQDIVEATLTRFFKRCGNVVNASVFQNNNPKHNDYAIVDYDTEAAAEHALRLGVSDLPAEWMVKRFWGGNN